MSDIPGHLITLKEQIRERKKREKVLLEDPEITDIMFAHIANGGTLITLCEIWDVAYGRVACWINAEKSRRDKIGDAYLARNEWAKERILHELRCMAHFDIRKLLDDKGNVLDVSKWPAEAARAVESLDVSEIFAGSGDERASIGVAKKLKMTSKLKAIELLGKTQAMFTDKVEHSVTMTLADLVDASWKVEAEPEKDVTPKGGE